VGVRVGVMVGVRLAVQVAQWVADGIGVQVGTRVLVEVGTGVEVSIGVPVGTGVLVQTGVFVWVSDGTSEAVHVGEGVAEARAARSGRATAPVIMNETQAMDIKTRKTVSPKKRQPAALCLLRSGQLALRRLI
jgi:hypothetical protein